MESNLVIDLKRLLLHVSPRLLRVLATIKQALEHDKRIRLDNRLEHIAHDVVKEHGLVVQTGPFKGMTYISQAAGSALVPKLLGSYEAELHDVLASVLERQYDDVVNVGCGEGYYAVGFARRLTNAKVHAFDINPRSRELCAEMARVNNVSDRVVIHAGCDKEDLCRLTLKRALVVMDCEGCELDLLQPRLMPGLDACDVLVELHDFVNPKISRTILSRFAGTHDITVIQSAVRDPSTYPAICDFSADDQRLAVAEFRPTVIPMQWALMTAKVRAFVQTGSSKAN